MREVLEADVTVPVPGLSGERLAEMQERVRLLNPDDPACAEDIDSLDFDELTFVAYRALRDRVALLVEVVRLREERDKAQRQVEAVEVLGRRLDPVDPKTIRAALAIEDGQT